MAEAVMTVDELCRTQGLKLPGTVPGFVDGKRLEPTSAGVVEVRYPGTEEVLYTIAETSPYLVDQAVGAARAAFEETDWPRLSHNARKRVLRRVVDVIERHSDELAAIQALEIGLPLAGVKTMHMPRTVENFEFFMEVAGTWGGETYTQTGNYLSVVTREPVGVAALLAPWNAPLVLASMKLAAALAVGNTCVLKGSEFAPYSLLRFVELLHEAGLPPGVVNVVNGRGAVTGEALTNHPEVDLINFVGGTATGQKIMRSAAAGIRKVGLELGGKSANIVLESADIDLAIDGSLLAMLAGNGAQCLAGSRLLVQRSIADEFIDRFVRRLSQVRVGDPFADGTEVGPMAFAAHRDRILGYVEVAEQEGGKVLCGGRTHPHFERGYFVEPTAVLATSNSSRVCQEEIFGPFVSILEVDGVDEAVAVANDSKYGLVSYVWSNDLPSVVSLSRRIRAGTVWVNTSLTRDLRAPFGGYRQSGIGRDGLRGSVELMTEEKTVMIPTRPLELPKLGLSDQ